MEKILNEEDWVPGGKNYNCYLPFKPKTIFFLKSYYLLCFDRGFSILPNDVPRNRSEVTFNQLCAPFYHSFSSLSDYVEETISSPEIYHKKEGDEGVELYFRQSKFFFCLLWKEKSGDFVVKWKKKIESDCLFSKSNKNGSIVFSTGRTIALLDDKGRLEIIYEESDTLYKIDKTPSRNEFGIEDLFYWSPDTRKIAFYRTDDSRVAEYPVVMLAEPISTVEMIKYPMAGQSSETVSLSVLNLDTKEVVAIDVTNQIPNHPINHFEAYITSVTWSPDSTKILLCELERSQKYCQVKEFSAETGAFVRYLWDESSDKYVEPESPFHYWIDSLGEENVLFLSQRSGHNHLYRFQTKESIVTPVTEGDWDILEVTNLFPLEGSVCVTSTFHSPLSKEVLRVSLDDKSISVLGQSGGCNHVYFGDSSNDWIAFHEHIDNPGEVLFSSGGVFRVDNPFAGVKLSEKKIGFIEKDGEKLYYRIQFPLKKQKNKYPVFFYVYGGPHVQLVSETFGSATKGVEEVMATNGFVTFCIDPHGSANRGRLFESVIYQQINQPQLEDYDFALDWFLKEYEQCVDATKLFIYGWSFGGYMTLSMLLNSRHHFVKGIAGGAVVDWRYYEVMYTERYMGEKNEETENLYDKVDVKNHIHKLTTPVCLIHCDNDPVVLWQHPFSMIKIANSRSDVISYLDFFPFPGHQHNVQGPERVQLIKKINSLIISCL